MAGVAQLVEQLTCNQPVGGSTPLASSIFSSVFEDLQRLPGLLLVDKEGARKQNGPLPVVGFPSG